MFKATVIGHYGGGLEYYDGQTMKTKSLTKELIRCYGDKSIKTVDTHGGIKSLIYSPRIISQAIRESNNVVMLPAHRGVKVFAPLMVLLRRLNPSCRIHYAVVGGWLPEMVRKNSFLKIFLKQFSGIYVETRTMKQEMEALGFSNIFILPNFKETGSKRKTICERNIFHEPYSLCTFSRVLKEKGIEDAVEAINRINREQGKPVFLLDIYGPIDETEREWFESLSHSFNDSVCYKGVVPSNKSTNLLANYFVLLFPTHYYTEGIPGTILDAYSAGVPVIASKWRSFEDVVDEGVTGFGYGMDEDEGLYKVLEKIRINPELINELRANCVMKFTEFTPKQAVKVLIEQFA